MLSSRVGLTVSAPLTHAFAQLQGIPKSVEVSTAEALALYNLTSVQVFTPNACAPLHICVVTAAANAMCLHAKSASHRLAAWRWHQICLQCACPGLQQKCLLDASKAALRRPGVMPQVFREPSVDTKVVVASGPDTILIAFRGTASWANLINDLQVCFMSVQQSVAGVGTDGCSWSMTGRAHALQAWMVPHAMVDPDRKGGNTLAPRVHRGFFASWHRNGLDQRVLGHVRGLVSGRTPAELGALRVIVTGVRPSCGRRVSVPCNCWPAA